MSSEIWGKFISNPEFYTQQNEPSVKATGLYALPKQENKSGQGGESGAKDPENWIQPRKKAEEIPRMVSKAKSQDYSHTGL